MRNGIRRVVSSENFALRIVLITSSGIAQTVRPLRDSSSGLSTAAAPRVKATGFKDDTHSRMRPSSRCVEGAFTVLPLFDTTGTLLSASTVKRESNNLRERQGTAHEHSYGTYLAMNVPQFANSVRG